MPMTLNVYKKPAAAAPTRPGELLGGVTQAVIIPFRPEADPTCATPTQWRASDNQCYNGMAFNVTFNLSSLGVTLPDDVIVDVAVQHAVVGSGAARRRRAVQLDQRRGCRHAVRGHRRQQRRGVLEHRRPLSSVRRQRCRRHRRLPQGHWLGAPPCRARSRSRSPLRRSHSAVRGRPAGRPRSFVSQEPSSRQPARPRARRPLP